MGDPFLLKLQTFTDLGEGDSEFVRRLCQRRERVPSGTDLIVQGEAPDTVKIVLSGLANRYKMLPDGERQIVAFLVPGDICDLHVALLGVMDHSIATNSETELATISRDEVREIVQNRPALGRALLVANLIDMAVLREWVVNNGRRDAYGRIAHLLWELYLRYSAVGMVEGHHFGLPITQQDLADATSLSYVHVSRTLTRLKDERVIEWSNRTVGILDPAELRNISGFDPAYLHRPGRETLLARLSEA